MEMRLQLPFSEIEAFTAVRGVVRGPGGHGELLGGSWPTKHLSPPSHLFTASGSTLGQGQTKVIMVSFSESDSHSPRRKKEIKFAHNTLFSVAEKSSS